MKLTPGQIFKLKNNLLIAFFDYQKSFEGIVLKKNDCFMLLKIKELEFYKISYKILFKAKIYELVFSIEKNFTDEIICLSPEI